MRIRVPVRVDGRDVGRQAGVLSDAATVREAVTPEQLGLNRADGVGAGVRTSDRGDAGPQPPRSRLIDHNRS
jgi:hypothetical protein